jgi:hypothetical protein
VVVQAVANGSDVAFALAQSILGRVHGVVTRHKIVGMFDGGAEDERGVGRRFEFNGILAFLEYSGFTG